MKIRIISIMLSSLVILSTFVSCKTSEEKTSSAENNSSGEIVTEPENNNSKSETDGAGNQDSKTEEKEDDEIDEGNNFPPEISTDISGENSLVAERIVIDNLGKLAYYSGWTVLYNNGFLGEYNIVLSENEKSPMEYMDSATETNQEFNVRYDVSEQDIEILPELPI